jgi:hypothetical protein
MSLQVNVGRKRFMKLTPERTEDGQNRNHFGNIGGSYERGKSFQFKPHERRARFLCLSISVRPGTDVMIFKNIFAKNIGDEIEVFDSK